MGRASTLSSQDRLWGSAVMTHPILGWEEFSHDFVDTLLQGQQEESVYSGHLLDYLRSAGGGPVLLYLNDPEPRLYSSGLSSNQCIGQLQGWMAREWPSIKRVYRSSQWQELRDACCLSGVWIAFVEALADPAWDALWVEPINDRSGEMHGVLIQCLNQRDWNDEKRKHLMRNGARLASHLWTCSRRSHDERKVLHKDCLSGILARGSHALRSPLNAIIGYGELLREDLHATGMETGAADADQIVHAAKRLSSMLEDVLDFAKLEVQGLASSTDAFCLTDLLAQLQEQAAPLLENKNNRLKVNNDLRDVELAQDRGHLLRVLSHLLANANRAVRDSEIRLDIGGEDSEIWFWVRDGGPGLSERQRSELRQGEPVTPDEKTGQALGIGLALSYRLARLMGGALSWRDQENGGGVVLQVPRHQPRSLPDA